MYVPVQFCTWGRQGSVEEFLLLGFVMYAFVTLNCEQSLVFLCKVTAIALDEIRTGRVLREKADCK